MENQNEEKNKENLKRALTLMNCKHLGVVEISIEFSGSGDSGDIDEVYFRTKKDSYEYIDMPDNKAEDLIRDFAWDIIASKVNTVGDWVNNEGGYGHITIDVENNTFNLDYSQRTTEDHDWYDEMLFI